MVQRLFGLRKRLAVNNNRLGRTADLKPLPMPFGQLPQKRRIAIQGLATDQNKLQILRGGVRQAPIGILTLFAKDKNIGGMARSQ